MADTVGSLQVELSLDKSKFSSALSGVKAEAEGLGTSLENSFKSVGSALGTALKVGAVAGIAAATAAVVTGTQAFSEYESGLNNVAKTTGMTAEQTKAFGKELRAFSLTSGDSVTELEKMAAGLGAVGIANDKILDSTKQVSVLTTAYGTNVEKTTNFVGSMIKMYDKDSQGLKQVSSALNVLEGASRATPEYLMDFMDAMVPMSGMFEINTDKALAFGSTMADAGIDAAEGATSIKSAILYALSGPDQKAPTERIDELTQAYIKMGKSAAEAKKMAKEQATTELGEGNARMTSWAKLMGVDVKELTNMINTDFIGTMKKSAQALNNIKGSTERASKANEIWGSYGLKAIGTMAGQAENYDNYLKLIEQDTLSGSQSAQKEWDKVGETTAFAFDQLKAGMNDIKISIGEATSGPIKSLIDYFMQLQPAIKSAVEALVGGDVAGAFSQFAKIGTKVFDDVVNSAQKAFSSLGNFLTQYLTSSNINSAFNRMVDMAESSFAKLGDALTNAPWGAWASEAMNILSNAMQKSISAGLDFGAWIANKLHSISSTDAASAGKTIAEALMNAIKGALSALPGILSSAFSSAMSIGGDVLRIAASFGQGVVDAVGGAISSAAGTMVSFGKQIIDSIGLGISSGVNSVIGAVETIVNAAISAISKLGGALSSAGLGSLPGVGSLVNGMANMSSVSLGKWNYTGFGTGGLSGGSSGSTTGSNYGTYEGYLAWVKAGNNPQNSGGYENYVKMTYGKDINVDPAWIAQAKAATSSSTVPAATDVSLSPSTTSSAWLSSLLGGATGSLYGAVTGSGYSGGTSSWLNDLLTGSGMGMTGGTWTSTTAVPVNVVSMGGTPVSTVSGSTGLTSTGGTSLADVRSAYQSAVANGETLKNMNTFNNMLVSASAEGSDFCEAMSEFGYLQEHTAGIFQESYIGPIQSGSATSSPTKVSALAAQTAAKTTTTAAKTAATTLTDSAYKLGNTFLYSGQNWDTAVSTSGQAWTSAGDAVNDAMEATAYSCFDMWDEGTQVNAQEMGLCFSQGTQQLNDANTKVSTTLAESGKFVDAASVKMSKGLTDWSEASEKHAAAMDDFRAKMETTIGSFTGLGTAIASIGSGNWSASFAAGGDSGMSATAAAAAQGAYQAIKTAFSTSGVWGSTPQSGGVTWGQAGNASWVGTGASASGIGAAASSQLSSGMSSGYGYSIGANGVVNIGKFAEGGVVTKPTLALIGEAGESEAVVPLSRAAEMGFGDGSQLVHTNLYIDGKKIADAVGPAIVQRMRAGAGIKVR